MTILHKKFAMLSLPRRTVKKLAQASIVKEDSWRSITVGGVTVDVRRPTTAEAKQRIVESRTAARRLGQAVSKPGVELSMKASTPRYVEDRLNPDLIIRKVGKKAERGQFIKGVFVKA